MTFNYNNYLLSLYNKNMSLYQIRQEIRKFLSREHTIVIFHLFIEENKNNKKIIEEFKKTSFNLD